MARKHSFVARREPWVLTGAACGTGFKPVPHKPAALLRRSRLAVALAAALAGGSLLGACQARFRDAVINGSKCFFFGVRSSGSVACESLVDPTGILELLLDGAGDTEE